MGCFQFFFISSDIIISSQFKGCPLLDLPITVTLTRQRKSAANPETLNFTSKTNMFIDLHSVLIEHIQGST